MTADLSRLSDGERRVLALLAGGHTAKSAAAATGLSVHAVNERLREARRKTGAGSSRELARLVGHQENRDEEIGVVGVAPPSDSEPVGATHPARGRRGGPIVMAILLLGGAAALALYAAAPQTPAPDPGRDAVFGDRAGEPRALRQRLLAERRDPAWANDGEATLRTLYQQVPGVRDLAVTCRATLCEVMGDLPPGTAEHGVSEAQALPARIGGDSGLTACGFAVGARNGGARFVAYWERRRS